MINEPVTCPQCGGKGEVVVSEEAARSFLRGLYQWEALRGKRNAELAGVLNEVQNYLRNRELSPLVFTLLDEVWWRLHAADEPIAETRRKVDTLGDDPEWLEK